MKTLVFLKKIAPSLFILTSYYSLMYLNLRSNYVSQYSELNSTQNIYLIFFDSVIIISFFKIAYDVGFKISRIINVKLYFFGNIALGVISIFFIFMLFFFVRALYSNIVIFILVLLNLSSISLKNDNQICYSFKWLTIVNILSLINITYLFLLAALPFLLDESLGDIANTYLELTMRLAEQHGIANYDPDMISSLLKFLGFEVFTVPFVLISNPNIVRFLGLAFCLLSFFSTAEIFIITNQKYNIKWFILFATSASILYETSLISFAHDRIFMLYLYSISLLFFIYYLIEKSKVHIFIFWVSLGIASCSNLAGSLIPISYCIVILLFKNTRRLFFNRKKILFVALWPCIALIFPIKNYIETGALFLNRFAILSNDSSISYRVIERTQGLIFNKFDRSIFSLLQMFLQLSFDYYYVYIFLALVILFIIRKSYRLDKIITLVFLHASILYILTFFLVGFGPRAHYRFFIFLSIPTSMILASLFSSYTDSIKTKKIFIIALIIFFAIVFQRNTQHSFLYVKDLLEGKKINQATELDLKKHKSINKFLTKSDKAIYFFSPKTIYTKAKLVQPNIRSVLVPIYTEKNINELLKYLKINNFTHIIVDDNLAYPSSDPNLSIIDDALTILFRPQNVIKYFIPLDAFSKFWIFKIDYKGLHSKTDYQRSILEIFSQWYYDALTKSDKTSLLSSSLNVGKELNYLDSCNDMVLYNSRSNRLTLKNELPIYQLHRYVTFNNIFFKTNKLIYHINKKDQIKIWGIKYSKTHSSISFKMNKKINGYLFFRLSFETNIVQPSDNASIQIKLNESAKVLPFNSAEVGFFLYAEPSDNFNVNIDINLLNYEPKNLGKSDDEHPYLYIKKFLVTDKPKPYHIGDTILFSSEHDGLNLLYNFSGWSSPEPWGVWGLGKEQTFSLYFDRDIKGTINFSLNFNAFLEKKHKNIHMKIFLNNQLSFEKDIVNSHNIINFTAELHITKDQALSVKFYIDSPESPSNLGISKDKRILGIGLIGLKITQKHSYPRSGSGCSTTGRHF